MEIAFIKTPQGLVPLDDDEAEKMRRFKNGAVVRSDFKAMRNGGFFRKWWALVKMAFDLSSERMQPMMHKGVEVKPCYERFRKDVTILAGHYTPVFNALGEVRLEADSLRWSEMSEEEFDKLYSDTIDCILQKILPHIKREELDRAVRLTLGFA